MTLFSTFCKAAEEVAKVKGEECANAKEAELAKIDKVYEAKGKVSVDPGLKAELEAKNKAAEEVAKEAELAIIDKVDEAKAKAAEDAKSEVGQTSGRCGIRSGEDQGRT